MTVTPACVDAIIGGLLREEAFVEPSHLQIVCTSLWEQRPLDSRVIDADALPADGVRRIIRDFFGDVLDSFQPELREEALEIFDALITPSRTRNIVSRATLENAPYRREKIRKQLLDRLADDLRLIRQEQRGRSVFVEISHEFLVAPILQALQDSRRYRFLHLRFLLDHLYNLETGRGSAERVDRDSLTEADCQTLHEARDRLNLSPWATSVIWQAMLGCDFPREVVAEWTEALARCQPSFEWLAVSDDSGPTRAARLAALSRLEMVGLGPEIGRAKLTGDERAVLARRLVRLARRDDWKHVRAVFEALSPSEETR